MSFSDFMDAKKKLRVPYALAVYGKEEITAVNAVLNSHNTGNGKFTKEFENKVSSLFSKKHGVMVNSGSSANLLALELLRLPKKSEIITPILTFSTTLAPIIQKDLLPVFIDVEMGRYTANINQIDESINDNTKALMIPSLIGSIPDFRKLRKIADEHNLFLIEDSCDTLGAKIEGHSTGKYSDISTTSFYGSHIITCAGGGGMICIDNDEWERRCRMLSSWGRTSAVNESEDIKIRYNTKTLDGVPYDSKYFFEEIGYNFLPTEISAAFGVEQLKKLDTFSKIRRKNFETLLKYFKNYQDFFILPEILKDIETNMLAFPLTIKKESPFSRFNIVKHLEEDNVQTRPVFTGNILKQPGFNKIQYKSYVSNFDVTDHIMKSSFLIGCNQGLTEEHINHMINSFDTFLRRYR